MNASAPLLRRTATVSGVMGSSHWRLVVLLMAICFTAHFNRVSMAVAADTRIMHQHEISPTAMGAVYSAFLIAYTFLMIPGGWLIDRRGPRFSLQMVCLGSAGFVALTGCVGWLASTGALVLAALIAIRSLMGMTSAPLHPASAQAIALHLPAGRRAAANGLVTGAALLGIASTYLLFGALIDWLDWPNAFITAAITTAGLGWLWSRHAPYEGYPRAVREVDDEGANVNDKKRPSPPAAGMLAWIRTHQDLALLTFSYAAVGYFQYLFFYWMHYYFESVLKLGTSESRLYATIPPLTMALAMPLGGWLSDRLESTSQGRAARRGLVMSAMTASAALLLAGTLASQPFSIVVWLSLALGTLGVAEGPFWVTAVEVGRRRGGTSAAIFNTGGNAGGILSPVVTPWISESLGFGWQTGIAAGSAVCLAGAALWWWIDLGPTSGLEGPVVLTLPERVSLPPADR